MEEGKITQTEWAREIGETELALKMISEVYEVPVKKLYGAIQCGSLGFLMKKTSRSLFQGYHRQKKIAI